jgi:hypothetical protein
MDQIIIHNVLKLKIETKNKADLTRTTQQQEKRFLFYRFLHCQNELERRKIAASTKNSNASHSIPFHPIPSNLSLTSNIVNFFENVTFQDVQSCILRNNETILLVGIGSVRREPLDSEKGDDGIGLLRFLPKEPSRSERAATETKTTGGLHRKRLYGPGRSADRVFGTGGSVPNGERRKAVDREEKRTVDRSIDLSFDPIDPM